MSSQLFNARGGLSVGLTGTNIISETGFGTFPVGITASGATFTGNVAMNSTSSYTGLASFASGITASGATFMGNIYLQNAEYIRNTTNGQIDLMPAPAASTAFGFYVDMTSWTYGVVMGTIRSSDGAKNTGGNFRFDVPLTVADNTLLQMGSDGQYGIYRSTAGNDTGQLRVTCNTANSGAWAIVDSVGTGLNNRSPGITHTNPNLYIYSAGAASANDFIRIEHDRTNANIVSGGTSGILIQPGSGWLGVSGGLSASGGITFASKVNAIQGVVSGYPRLEWCGITSGYDIIPSHWQSISAPISAGITANNAYFAPIFISQRVRVTSIGTQTGTNGAGNAGSFYLGLYDSDTYGFPANRLYGSASTALSTSSFSAQRISGVNTTVNPGHYWLAITYSTSGLTLGLSRFGGTHIKYLTQTSSTPVAQAGVVGLRKTQSGFTLDSAQTGAFDPVTGNNFPGIFYNAEAI
jgi:hypothetical protein